MQQYHGTLARREVLGRQANSWQRSLDSLTAVVAALHPTVPARTAALARYRVSLQQRVQAASQQADQALLKEVNAYLQHYGSAHGYTFIFGALEGGNIIYAAAPQNLTTEVLAGLNMEYDQTHSLTP